MNELVQLLAEFSDFSAPRDETRLCARLEQLLRRRRAADLADDFTDAGIELLTRLYQQVGQASRARALLLWALAATDHSTALRTFAELLATDPPAASIDAALAFVPLVQRPSARTAMVFPRLLDCLAQPDLAAAVLDLANLLTRQHLVPQHPATDRARQLAELLGGVVQGLQQLETETLPARSATAPVAAAEVVRQGVALVVSLCDALALIGDTSVTGKLHQAMGLSHRRLRAEAAVALAHLGDDNGTRTLVELAAEPGVRSRALAYLEELGQLEKARPEDQSADARAAGDLAEWLAQPAQFGMPPHGIESVDTCCQHWPGYEEPVDCRLFSFEYHAGHRTLEGLGLTGPVTHAFKADLADLPPGDIYAVFAGWHAEHDEIREFAATDLDPSERATWQSALDQVRRQGCTDIELAKVGHFFGVQHVVATARRGDQPGIVVAGEGEIQWFPVHPSTRAPGPDEIYWMYKGRKLLKAFNPE